MISECQLKELISLKAETKNLDFKESLNWNTATNDEKSVKRMVYPKKWKWLRFSQDVIDQIMKNEK